jgi:AraC-like DNA-binding protein
MVAEGRNQRGTLSVSAGVSAETADRYVRVCLAEGTPPRASDLARVLGVSRGTLTSAFKRHPGTTPSSYLRERQLAYAKAFLLRGWTGNGSPSLD